MPTSSPGSETALCAPDTMAGFAIGRAAGGYWETGSPRETTAEQSLRATTAEHLPAPALWLIRHGESTWNTAGLCQGHNDEPELTERGLRQAAEAAAQFGYRPVRAIYASDLRRAQQTAAAFSAVLGLPVHTDPRLRERRLGVLEGTPHKTVTPADLGHGDGRLFDADTKPEAANRFAICTRVWPRSAMSWPQESLTAATPSRGLRGATETSW